jgi:predicted transcriptional regulator
MAVKRRLPAEARRRQVLRIVRREPCCTADEIGAVTGLGRAAVRLYLQQLADAGRIRGQRYCVPRPGLPGCPPLVWVAA